MINKFINLANKIPEAVAVINENKPIRKIPNVSYCKKTLPGIVDPTAKPKIIITTFIKLFSATSAKRLTTPETFIKLPNINIPINGDAEGTKTLTSNIEIIGKSILVLFDTESVA